MRAAGKKSLCTHNYSGMETTNGTRKSRRGGQLSLNHHRHILVIVFAVSVVLLQLAIACDSDTQCCNNSTAQLANNGTANNRTERPQFRGRFTNKTRRVQLPNITQYGDELPPLGDPDDIRDLQEQNKWLPQECRTDLCPPQNTTDLTGTIEWQYTSAGDRAFVPCPNGAWLDQYFPTPPPAMVAYRPCYPPTERYGLKRVFYEGAYWGDPVTDICRWSSETTSMLDDLRKTIADEVLDMIGGPTGNITVIIVHLREANRLLRSIPVETVTEIDVLMVASMIDTAVSAGVEELYDLTADLGDEVVELADHMLDLDQWTLLKAHGSCLSIADNLQIYTEYVKMGWFGEKLVHFGRNLFLEIDQSTPEYVDNIPKIWAIAPETDDASDPEPVVSIEFPWARLFVNVAKRRNGTSTQPSPGDERLAVDENGTEYIEVLAQPENKLRITAIVYFTGKFFVSELARVSPADDTALVYIKAYADGEPMEETIHPLAITFYHTRDGQDQPSDPSDLVCGSARLLSDDDPVPDVIQRVELQWDASQCTMNVTNENYTVCMCTILEIIGLIRDSIPTPEPVTPEVVPGPLDFFGINSLGLTITSYIGYSISIISLLMTILTYAIFPKLRRGRPTLIHVNLCVAILFLLIFLISSVAFCDTVIGCRIANLIRIYIILVSMMWNGVEAVWMYISLIKVYAAHASNFVLKAGLVAWGVPLIFVAIAALVEIQIFDGVLVNCNLSCRLSPFAFYCLFLAPMVIIVVFNSVVFGFVLRVIRRIYATDGKKTPLNQLKGAVAILVLLGISWIFGAAAAVNFQFVPSDFEPRATANVFQALFAIAVAFQGFFIFIFHCARFKDVREQWKKTLTPRSRRRYKRKSSCIPTVSTGSGSCTVQDTRL